MNIDYPTQGIHTLNDAEQFLAVFTQLVQDKVASVSRTQLGVNKIFFKDGSSVGTTWLWKQAGEKQNY